MSYDSEDAARDQLARHVLSGFVFGNTKSKKPVQVKEVQAPTAEDPRTHLLAEESVFDSES